MGVLNALKSHVITFDDARYMILSPYIYEEAKKYKCDESVLNSINLSLELDVIGRQFPEMFEEAIKEIENMIYKYLANKDIVDDFIITCEN